MTAIATKPLPPELVVDTSDRSRGIRIALRPSARPRPVRVDCAGGPGDDVAIRSLEYAVVDVETTGGAWSRGHRITEIAAVRVRGDGTILDEYRSLVNPERPIPAVITELTRITPDMVRVAPTFPDVAADVAQVLDGAVFVAHNAMFDWRFVGAELARAGHDLGGRTLCTVQLARKVVPEVTSRSLDALSWFFDVHNEARHRAWGDARATTIIFRRLLERLDTLEVNRWTDLQELLRRRAKRRRRIANPHSASEA